MNTLNSYHELLPTESIIHAGPLLLAREGGNSRLKNYLVAEDADTTVLVHRGEPALHDAADEAHVPDISTGPMLNGSSEELAAELAISRGADRLDYAIAQSGVESVHGAPIRWLAVRDALRMSKLDSLDERLREKLKAGCLAVKQGISQVRIGNPMSLQRDFATALVDEPPLTSLPVSNAPQPKPWDLVTQLPLPVAAAQRGISSVAAATSTRHTPWRERKRPWELGTLRLTPAYQNA